MQEGTKTFPLISVSSPHYLPKFTAEIRYAEPYLHIHITQNNKQYVQAYLTALISYSYMTSMFLFLGHKPRLGSQSSFSNQHGGTQAQAQVTLTKYTPAAIFNCVSPTSFLILYPHTCFHPGFILFNIIDTCRHLQLRLTAFLVPSFLILYTHLRPSWIHPF